MTHIYIYKCISKSTFNTLFVHTFSPSKNIKRKKLNHQIDQRYFLLIDQLLINQQKVLLKKV